MQKCENCANLDYCVDAGEPCADYLSVFEDEEMESDEFEEEMESDEFEEEMESDEFDEVDFEDEDFDDTDEFDMEDYTGGESWEDFCEHEDFE